MVARRPALTLPGDVLPSGDTCIAVGAVGYAWVVLTWARDHVSYMIDVERTNMAPAELADAVRGFTLEHVISRWEGDACPG